MALIDNSSLLHLKDTGPQTDPVRGKQSPRRETNTDGAAEGEENQARRGAQKKRHSECFFFFLKIFSTFL